MCKHIVCHFTSTFILQTLQIIIKMQLRDKKRQKKYGKLEEQIL